MIKDLGKIADNLDLLIEKWFKKNEKPGSERVHVKIVNYDKNQESDQNITETEYNVREQSSIEENNTIIEKNIK